MKKTIYLLFSLISIASCAPKAFETIAPSKISLVGFDWLGDLYRPSRVVRDSIFEKKGNQMGAWFYTNIGQHRGALATWDAPRTDTVRGLMPEESAAFANFVAMDAQKYIVEAARDHEIVVINELHHVAQYRVFTTQLLRDLYKEGYRYLGLETLVNARNADSTLNAQRFATLKSGIYSSEPQFGNLIRTALRLGFTLFSYESTEPNGNPRDREITQAKNIQQFLENRAKDGKTIIYCGGAHATEGEMGGKWEKAMAARLTDYLKIDPLTVNQTNYSERSKKQFENKYFQAVSVQKPTVFIDENGKPFGEKKDKTWHDIYVFHPRTQNGARAQWLIYDHRKIANFELDDPKIKFPCLVLAYKYDEWKIDPKAVPYDIQEADENATSVALVLERGAYQIVIVNADGSKVMKKWRF